MNREAWLTTAVEKLRPMLDQVGAPLTRAIQVSVGFPSAGGLTKVEAQCWAGKNMRTAHVFIGPRTSDAVTVLRYLLHELVHAAVGTECGHRGPFQQAMVSLGFNAPYTQSNAGPALREGLREIADELGSYPHKALTAAAKEHKKQSTRMIKLVCECGYTVRTTQKWIDTGLPTCPCGEQLAPE